jgi:hypothetical protein
VCVTDWPAGIRRLAEIAPAWRANGDATGATTASALGGVVPLTLTRYTKKASASFPDASAGSAFARLALPAEGVRVDFQWGVTRPSGYLASSKLGDGLAFVLHNDARGTAALGEKRAGCMGYCGIGKSVGVAFDFADNTQHKPQGLAFLKDGVVPDVTGSKWDDSVVNVDASGRFGKWTDADTWAVFAALFADLKLLFPEAYMNVGGDEVDITCWQSDPEINAWMAAHNYPAGDWSFIEAHYYDGLTTALAGAGFKPIFFAEAFGANNGAEFMCGYYVFEKLNLVK